MAIYHEDIVGIDLESGTIHRSFANCMIGEADIAANRYGVRLFRNGEPVNAGTSACVGYFIRHNRGDTVIINGGVVGGNIAYVTLPESCYVYDGPFSLVIKLVGTDISGTMRIVDGTIVDSMIGTAVDPGSAVPDLASLLEVIDQAEEAADYISGFSITTELIDGENYRTIITTPEEEG